MEKNSKKLLEENEKLTNENKSLKHQLRLARESIEAIKTRNIDALVIAHKKDLKIYTEKTADKIYRILIEKMHEGAVALNEDGTILYCNSYFAKMVDLPLQKVMGAKFGNFINDSSKKAYIGLIKKGWQGYSQSEVFIVSRKGIAIPVLMSVNTLSLENNFILSIILTDITIQKQNRAELRTVLIEKIITVISEINHYSDEMPKINYSNYISKKLNHNYTYLANIFSAVKGLTIQQFIIINKIEKVKELMLYGELNLTEISYKLHYSSVAHLSSQFKKITGLSPSSYKHMKQKNNRESP
jgi:PAS domain S-box-containing protein